MDRKKLITIIILSLLLILLGGVLVKDKLSPKPLSVYAQEIFKRCSKEKDAIECYNKEIPKLMDKISMEDAFRVTSLIQDKDKDFAYCHVLGHELSAIETKKDPEKWKDVVGRCPMGVCSNGCVHGAFQERFRSEYLIGEDFEDFKKELSTICEKREGFDPSGLERGSCYHALGHLLMYVTGADIEKSISTCYEVAKKSEEDDLSPICLDGVFMQIFQPLEDEDFELVEDITPEKGEVESFCLSYQGAARASCWTESWPLFIDEITTPDGLVEFCSFLNETGARQGCFRDIFYGLPILSRFNTDAVKDLCRRLPSEYTGMCLSMTAVRLLEIDYGNIGKATNFCKQLKDKEKEYCFEELVEMSDFNFKPGSEEFLELCESMPLPWRDVCLEKQ